MNTVRIGRGMMAYRVKRGSMESIIPTAIGIMNIGSAIVRTPNPQARLTASISLVACAIRSPVL